MTTAGELFEQLKGEGAHRSSEVRVISEDAVLSDIVMVEADDDGIIYLKTEKTTMDDLG